MSWIGKILSYLLPSFLDWVKKLFEGLWEKKKLGDRVKNREELAVRLEQLTKELKDTKKNPELDEDSRSSKLTSLKAEIREISRKLNAM